MRTTAIPTRHRLWPLLPQKRIQSAPSPQKVLATVAAWQQQVCCERTPPHCTVQSQPHPCGQSCPATPRQHTHYATGHSGGVAKHEVACTQTRRKTPTSPATKPNTCQATTRTNTDGCCCGCWCAHNPFEHNRLWHTQQQQARSCGANHHAATSNSALLVNVASVSPCYEHTAAQPCCRQSHCS